MNKKQLLSIALLLSVVTGVNANPVYTAGSKAAFKAIMDGASEATAMELARKAARAAGELNGQRPTTEFLKAMQTAMQGGYTQLKTDLATRTSLFSFNKNLAPKVLPLAEEAKIAAAGTGVGVTGGTAITTGTDAVRAYFDDQAAAKAAEEAAKNSWSAQATALGAKVVNPTTITAAGLGTVAYGLSDMATTQAGLKKNGWAKPITNSVVAAGTAAAAYRYLPSVIGEITGTKAYFAALAATASLSRDFIREELKHVGANQRTFRNAAVAAATVAGPWYALPVLNWVQSNGSWVLGKAADTAAGKYVAGLADSANNLSRTTKAGITAGSVGLGAGLWKRNAIASWFRSSDLKETVKEEEAAPVAKVATSDLIQWIKQAKHKNSTGFFKVNGMTFAGLSPNGLAQISVPANTPTALVETVKEAFALQAMLNDGALGAVDSAPVKAALKAALSKIAVAA